MTRKVRILCHIIPLGNLKPIQFAIYISMSLLTSVKQLR
jgi:hypothetical protein